MVQVVINLLFVVLEICKKHHNEYLVDLLFLERSLKHQQQQREEF